ncbi:MAG: hypothetical protein R3209_03450 [Salinimicrobium sediminis]|nr:hypothetical protein [Salinimicrobium sediminis]
MNIRRTLITEPLRRTARALAVCAIASQFLVPAGYMPGALANGTPYVLCHVYTGGPAARTPAADALEDHDGDTRGSAAHGFAAHGRPPKMEVISPITKAA